ncbi:MAG: hypothetical protein HYV54_00605 [Parcubacteria group bacterium]|nr:hypothetical protein [Parcubacteria group bacterium]
MLFVLIPSLIVLAGMVVAGRTIYKKIPKDLAEWDAILAKEDFGPTFYEKALAAAFLKSKEAALGVSTKLVYKLKITSLKTDNFFSRLLREIKDHKTVMEAEAESVDSEDMPKNIPFKTKLTPVADSSLVASRESFGFEAKTIPEPQLETRVSFANQEQQLINQLAYNPKDVSAYKRLGWLYLENSKPIEARQAFKMAVKLGSKDKIIITQLLEMGGTVHKEGIVSAQPAALASAPAKSKHAKSRPKKIKVRRV